MRGAALGGGDQSLAVSVAPRSTSVAMGKLGGGDDATPAALSSASASTRAGCEGGGAPAWVGGLGDVDGDGVWDGGCSTRSPSPSLPTLHRRGDAGLLCVEAGLRLRGGIVGLRLPSGLSRPSSTGSARCLGSSETASAEAARARGPAAMPGAMTAATTEGETVLALWLRRFTIGLFLAITASTRTLRAARAFSAAWQHVRVWTEAPREMVQRRRQIITRRRLVWFREENEWWG